MKRGDGSRKPPEGKILGSIAKPPFVRLPEPGEIFRRRAGRYRQHVAGSPLGPYLELLAAISDLQARLLEELPVPVPPDAAVLARATGHGMPPLDRAGFLPDAGFVHLLERLCEEAVAIDMPQAARSALQNVLLADGSARLAMIGNVLQDAVPFEAIAEHVFVAAAVQVHFVRLAAQLDPEALKPVGDGLCPSCGGSPVTSVIVDWPNARGTRFCVCSTCSTLWNYVRARCSLCGSTKEISFREVEGGEGSVKAEICESCRGYVKVLYQDKDPALDPVADDVASLGLDLLVRELGYRRGAVNPYLIGY